MFMRRFSFLFPLLFCCTYGFSQQADSAATKRGDSLLLKALPTDSLAPFSTTEDYRLSAREFIHLQAGSIKEAFLKPFHMSGRNWADAGKFALVLGALSFADRPVQELALDLRNANQGLVDVSHQVTRFGGPYVVYAMGALGAYSFLLKKEKLPMGALGAYSFLLKKEKLQTTTLLSVQAFITSGLLERTVKLIAGRQRPFIISSPKGGPEPIFHGPVYVLRERREDRVGSSFPSGHTTAAFAVATVFAETYKEKPWIPVVAYSTAGLVGLSRLTENKHWLTDVVAGAALGYVSGKLVVKNYRRYAGLRAAKAQKTKLNVTVALNQGVITPGFVYRF
ncbi:MAG: phosphatase PAP2 family protein [Chitinophagaceae bacterium]|nr:MAG: phosphatase PAP2 family protein [Chitinophagaceae bacterium]